MLSYRIVFLVLFLSTLLGACSLSFKDQSASSPQHEQSQVAGVVDSKESDLECRATEGDLDQTIAVPGVSLWDRVRDGYQLPSFSNKRIDAERRWYAKHPAYMTRVTKRAERYLFHIVESLEARDMPLELALLPIVESAFDPFAYSHGRASGMWQIIPGTGKMLGLKQNWWYDGRRDVVASTEAALTYLERLNKRFKGDWLLALASYNAGAGNVSKAIRKNKRKGKPTDFWHLDLPRETRAYVPRLIALSQLITDPHAHKLTLHPIENQPFFSAIDVDSQIDLAQAAAMAEIDMDTLYHLNPGFNRWATDPKGPHQLLIPIAQANIFSQSLAAIPASERVTWERYTIRPGDSLSTIAKKFKISVDSLKSINQLKSHVIRVGKPLMVPVATASDAHYSFSADARVAKRYASVGKKEKGQRIDYVVQAGDSLWTIGRRHNVSVAKLARWNSMAPRDPLKPGQTLKIWTKSPHANANSGVIRKVSYRVRSGDSLARIAQKFSLSVNDILRWNAIQKSKYLQPGQRLTLFVDVTRGPEA